MKKTFNKKPQAIIWHHFTRHGDAIFLSLKREIRISVLSVATLAVTCPDSSAATMAMSEPRPVDCCATVPPDSPLSLLSIPPTNFPLTDSLLAEVEVSASRAPLPADKAVRLVQVITRQDIEASSAQSVNDLLKLSAGVDVRQRGGFGIQTDIGINGGTEDQLTVLLNGINISNPHTGHLTVDLPVNVDDIERIEIIEGGASRIYGSQAFAGAINIITRTETHSDLGLHLQAGFHGTIGTNAFLAMKTTHFNQRISGGYTRSDGGTTNNDFNKANAYWNGQYSSRLLDATLQAGLSTMNYGANTFYGTGSDTQYEEDRRYLLALQVEYKSRIHIPIQLYWNRSLDHYVWQRANPQAYQNFHQTNVYGANANAHTTWTLGKSAIGIELRRENILSTRLGKEIPAADQHRYKVPGHDTYYKYKDGRTNLSLFFEHDILLRCLTLSLGMLAHHNTALDSPMRFYPGIDISWRPTDSWKLFASFNQSLRTPTYTDLYYNGPGLQGNLRLKPERSTDWHLGASYTGTFYRLQAKGFYRHGTDMIDWIKHTGDTFYQTANSNIDNIGAEILTSLDFTQRQGIPLLQRLTLGYCYNYKWRVHPEPSTLNYISRMTFLRHKLVLSLNHRILSHFTAQWDFTLKNRSGSFDNAQTGQSQPFGTYATLDLKIQWAVPHYTLYLQGNNLTNHRYYDHPNVLQPGIWLTAGAKFRLAP